MTDTSPKAQLEKAIWDALRLMGFGTQWTADAMPTVDAIIAAAEAYAHPADMITVPRPMPDEVVIAVCGEDGARAWVKGKQNTLGDAEFLALVAPLLAEAQQRLRQEHGKPVPA